MENNFKVRVSPIDINSKRRIANAAIKKDVETYLAARPKGSTTIYSVMDAFGCNNYATEVGTTTRKDSTGAVIYKGKYMALWEKRDGKWMCIRDIGNDDEKKK